MSSRGTLQSTFGLVPPLPGEDHEIATKLAEFIKSMSVLAYARVVPKDK